MLITIQLDADSINTATAQNILRALAGHQVEVADTETAVTSDAPTAQTPQAAPKQAAPEQAAPEQAAPKQADPKKKTAPKKAASKPEPKPEPAEEPTPAATEPAAEAATGATPKDAISRATKLVSAGKTARVKAVLSELGAKKVSDLKGAKIAEFIKMTEEDVAA